MDNRYSDDKNPVVKEEEIISEKIKKLEEKRDLLFKKINYNENLGEEQQTTIEELKKKLHLLIRKRKSIHCPFCNRPYEVPKVFAAHILQHSKTKDIETETWNPVNSNEIEKKCFACNIGSCKQEFRTFYSLIRHYLRHTTYRGHYCPYPGCSKSFRVKVNLTTHMKAHSTDRPFKCKICSTCFKHKVNLDRHIKKQNHFPRKLNTNVHEGFDDSKKRGSSNKMA